MAYRLIFKVINRNLQQSCRLTQPGLLAHKHLSVLTCQRRSETPPSTLWGFVLGQRQQGFNVDCRLRNRSSPEDRDGGGQTSVSRYQSGSPKPSATQKVKEAGRDFTYLIVVLIGLGVTGGLLYVVFQELFSSSSPNKVYGKAFEKVKSHPEVIGAFGEPIKCYGETTRRGRRQQVSSYMEQQGGLKVLRLKFYIEGSEPGRKGTVHSESKENPETGKLEFRYIFVDMDTYPRRTIAVEDNR